jgi:diguanylate cyclase (GGDEF)-like protein
VLKTVAGCIRAALHRPLDFGARYGGEEFVIILPETELTGATLIAENIRNGVASACLPHADSPTGLVSVSIGVAMAFPRLGEGEYSLVNDADQALYDAKHRGRNRVCVAATYPGIGAGQSQRSELACLHG